MDDLSRLAERAEEAALGDLFAAATGSVRARLGLDREEVGTARLFRATGDRSTLLNRTLGLGVEAPDTRETVAAIRDRYASLGIARYYLHLHPDGRPAKLLSWVEEAGLVKGRGWVKFVRERQAPRPARSDLEVRRVGREEGDDFGRIVADGFGLGAECVPLLAELAGRTGWHLYLSYDGDEPAGAGALFVHERTGWCDWAATLPAFRRRGSQGVVLARRIQDALDLGCERILTTTGETVEGDPQHSYKNILRAGFRIAYLRENYLPGLGIQEGRRTGARGHHVD
jgi:hypothetical protein